MKLNQGLLLLLCVSLVCAPLHAHAVGSGIAFSKEILGNAKGNEFISGDYPGAVMMKINLWGDVQKPGIHYVPAKTDLLTLLSYAGGPGPKAIMDDVVVKRSIGGTQSVMHVDMDDVLNRSDKKPPVLEANDTVIINSHTPLFSENTLQVVGMIASLLTITLASIVLKKEFGGGN